MKVSELIKQLQDYPDDMDVVLISDEDAYEPLIETNWISYMDGWFLNPLEDNWMNDAPRKEVMVIYVTDDLHGLDKEQDNDET